jgi:hypothetical protein
MNLKISQIPAQGFGDIFFAIFIWRQILAQLQNWVFRGLSMQLNDMKPWDLVQYINDDDKLHDTRLYRLGHYTMYYS